MMSPQTYASLPKDMYEEIKDNVILDNSIPEGDVWVKMPAQDFTGMNRKARRAAAAMARRSK